MATPQQNTKVETLVEAIETFAINIAQGIAATRYADAAQLHEERLVARKEMADALRDFLAPSFRVITERENRVGDLSTISRRTVEPVDAISTKVMPKL
jgi:hypothetical protein